MSGTMSSEWPSFLDSLDRELTDKSPESLVAEVVEKPKPPTRDNEAFKARLLEKHMQVVLDIARFREIDPARDEAPPQSWIDEMGQKEAWQSFNVARAAWLDSKNAPVGLKLSSQMVIGMLKATAAEKTGRELNIGIAVYMTPPVLAGEEPLKQFPVREVER